MAGNLILCDTNIISVLRNNKDIIHQLQKIGVENIAISIMTVGELLWGVRNISELKQYQNSLKQIRQIPINEEICNLFFEISEKYCISRKIGIPDSFIAASSIYFDLELYTLNIKDFNFIQGVKLYKG
jgi:predicted nucleic acid-binding protein